MIVEALKLNSTLKELKIDRNKLSEEVQLEIKSVLESSDRFVVVVVALTSQSIYLSCIPLQQ